MNLKLALPYCWPMALLVLLGCSRAESRGEPERLESTPSHPQSRSANARYDSNDGRGEAASQQLLAQAVEGSFAVAGGQELQTKRGAPRPMKPKQKPLKPKVSAPTPLPGRGEPCAQGGACKSGLHCTADTNKCQSVGQTCATGKQGACGQGLYVLRNQRLECEGTRPSREICENSVDEDCNGLLNNGCPEVVLVDNYKIHCGSGGSGTHLIGRECPVGYQQGSCTVQGPQGGGLRGWTEWDEKLNDGSTSCRCRASCSSPMFKGGDWTFRVTAKPCSSATGNALCRKWHGITVR